MPNEYVTGALWSSTLPDWQRDYYSLLLLETLRAKSILVPYCAQKRDYSGANSGVIIYTEVMDTEPDWSPLTESDIWLRGAHLDSRTVQIALEIHGDILKFSEYSEIVQYVRKGDMNGLVRDKIGQNQTDYLDILCRNAFATHPHPIYGGDATSRATLVQNESDYFNLTMLETMRIHMEENDVPGVQPVSDNDIQTLVCLTTPRCIKDIRQKMTNWVSAQEYAGSVRLFNGEVGMWDGMRFVRTNRMRFRNAGLASFQSTLNGAVVAGQGAAGTVDTVYTPGQSNSTRYITLASVVDLEVGNTVTIHDATKGVTVLDSDGSQESRRVVSIGVGGAQRVALNKPLSKPHATGDYVTVAPDCHMSTVLGGPAVVYGVGEDPHVINPPVIDDLQMVQRVGWRGFLKFQQFRPEFYEAAFVTGSTD
jgi:N4-gp56 family major capsid protein